MDKSLKQEFVEKIYEEFTSFREDLTKQSQSDLIAEAYKIETFSSLYEALLAKSDQLSDMALLNLLNMGTGVIEALYDKWLGVKDHSYEELENYVDHELTDMEGYDLHDVA